jgi:hypothetical protein
VEYAENGNIRATTAKEYSCRKIRNYKSEERQPQKIFS